MKIGLVARADLTGLGHQSREFARHMEPEKTLIIDLCHLSPKGLTLHPEWYTNPVVIHGVPKDKDTPELKEFVEGLDIIYTAETPYNYELFTMAEKQGVKTILHMNPEFNDYYLDHRLTAPTVFAAPTHWMYDTIPDPKIVLPVPIAMSRFRYVEREPGAPVKFLHVVGHPAIHDRAGTRDLLAALRYVESECTVTLKCQEPGHVSALISELGCNKGKYVTLVIDSTNVDNYWDLYTGHDVLIQPRRFGGLNLPAQEALAAGLVVLMPNISPNADLLPSDWLFPAEKYGHFMARQPVDLYLTNPLTLAGMIDRYADTEIIDNEKARSHLYAEPLSWDNQEMAYTSVFENIVAGNIPMVVA